MGDNVFVFVFLPFLPVYFYILPKAVEDMAYSFRFAKEECNSLQEEQRSDIDLTTYAQMEIQKLKEKYKSK